MTSLPDPSKKNEFDELHKIQNSDINAFVMAEDIEGLNSTKKRNIWYILVIYVYNFRDSVKKRYVLGKRGETGELMKDKEDMNQKDSKSKQAFGKWKKRNLMTIQGTGEKEDVNMAGRAK